MLKMLAWGAVNGAAVVLAWKGLDFIITVLGGTPSVKDYWTIYCAAAAGAGNVIAWRKED